jgi:hypothetical protein
VRLSIVLCALCSACGTRTGVGVDDAATGAVMPSALYATGEGGCAVVVPITSTAIEMESKQFGESVAVVELFYQDECTGAGGQYILAREVDGFRSFFIGAHACWSLPSPLPTGPGFGVVRYNQTAGLFHVSPDVCIGFPDRPPGLQTDVTTRAIAVFETLSDARAFAATLR